MKILVCGGRDYTKFWRVQDILNEYEITEIICGGATGADAWARSYGEKGEIPVKVLSAEWDLYGRAAGPIRNKLMLQEKPDLVIAFPGGKGTANMVRQAKEEGIEVREITED